MNAELLVQLLLGLVDRAAAISQILNQAKAEGRDVTDEELNLLTAQDDAAKLALDQAIAVKKS